LYKLGYYRDKLKDGGVNIFPSVEDTPTRITKNIESGDVVYIVYNNKNNLSSSVVNHTNFSSIHQTFKDYIGFLEESVDLENDTYVMIMESCDTSDVNDCKYAYLGVEK